MMLRDKHNSNSGSAIYEIIGLKNWFQKEDKATIDFEKKDGI